MLDHYNTLKVASDAPPEVIKAAYRALQRKYHPDLNEGGQEAAAHERSTLINLAYQELIEPARRANYDRAWLATRNRRLGRSSAVDRSPHSWLRSTNRLSPTSLVAGTVALAAALAVGSCISARSIARTPPSGSPAPAVTEGAEHVPSTRKSGDEILFASDSVEPLKGRLTYQLRSNRVR